MSESDRDRTTAYRGFFPAVVGEDVNVQDAGGLIFFAKHNLTVTRGGGQWLVAGRDQTIQQAGGAILISREARVANGFVGLLVAGRTTLEGSARVLVTMSVPVALAAAGGLVVGLMLGRRRAHPA